MNSSVKFDINFHSDEMYGSQMPVEIRKPNATFVRQAVTQQNVELPPGSYIASVRLPAGQEINAEFTVPVNASGFPINLNLDPADVSPHESEEVQRLVRGIVPLTPRFRPGQVLLTSVDLVPFPLPEPEIVLRAFTGNPLRGDVAVWNGPGWFTHNMASSPSGYSEFRITNQNVRLIQVLRRKKKPLNFLIPITNDPGNGCHLVVRAIQDEIAVEIHPSSCVADALLQYAGRGGAAEARTLAVENAEQLLHDKIQDPIAAAVGAYTLLRLANLESLHDWTGNLHQWFAWLSDGAAIRAEHLARLGQHAPAIRALLDLETRGLPIFAEGLTYALNRLRMYLSVASDPEKARKLELSTPAIAQMQSLLEKLQRFASYVDFAQPVVCYLGLDPNNPDRELLTLPIGSLGGDDISDAVQWAAPLVKTLPINLSGSFYPTYKGANSSFSPDTFRCAEETVTALLAKATTSDHPGMLLGKVQSGKTRTFISVLALAFDNGYDIAIVLSKNSRALIEQTIKRLNNEFESFKDDGDLEIYDIMHAPEKFGAFELSCKLIFVAKKQDDNLRHLIELFQNHPAMVSKRTLIIDDEADNASVGYTNKAGLLEARKIAKQISELRAVINQCSFLQVTATPYALYLQPTEIEVANVVSFKPTRPAFTEMVPVPKEYVGGEVYFGPSSRSQTDTLESLIHVTVDYREFDRLKKPDGRSFSLEDVLTAPGIIGYRSGIVNFIVGGCIQRINRVSAGEKPNKIRYSFLLHSEAGKGAHEWQHSLTKAIVQHLCTTAQSADPTFTKLVTDAYDGLKRSMVLDKRPVPSLDAVILAAKEAVMGEYLTVTVVNSDEDVAALLDNTGQLRLRSPLNIFIGGQVLDRGVTLASLIGFYYGRRPNKFQQDTVLQHSRMYGYRRPDLAVTRFYTSKAIRYAMTQMEEFDASLRSAIEAGGDQAVQFIRKAADGSVVPCSPNKILVATTQTIRPGKRILPIGFQTGYRTGIKGIAKIIEALDARISDLCSLNTDAPKLVPLQIALGILNQIEPTMEFPEDDAPPFDWDAARAALTHLSNQPLGKEQPGQVWIWAAKDRDSARMASESSHATYIETPDSEKTEGQIAKKFAIHHPILFLLRQNGSDAPDKGWRGTPFYWPVIRAQTNSPTAIYTAETID